MKKKYFVIAGIVWLILILAGIAWYWYDKPHRDASGIKPALTIDAVELYNQYQHDENAANKRFLDKVIEVKGTVSDVQQSSGITSLLLDAGQPAGGVNCSFSNNGSKKPLPSKGSQVTIKGKCSGMLMDVNLVDCVIEE